MQIFLTSESALWRDLEDFGQQLSLRDLILRTDVYKLTAQFLVNRVSVIQFKCIEQNFLWEANILPSGQET